MNRHERRAMAAQMRAESAEWPEQLREVPASDWPASARVLALQPVRVWRSRAYLAQLYAESPFEGTAVYRLTINRASMRADGHWSQDIPWEDLQRLKREAGFADWYGVEIYPRDRDVQNIVNMRHLWLLAEPLSIGWFAERKPGV